MVISKQLNTNKAQWNPPLKSYDSGNINTIFGIGFDNQADPDNSYNFLQRAYEDGYIMNNTYTF